MIADSVLDAVNLGVLIITRDGRITLWNRWLEEHSGHPREQVTGRVLWELYPEIRQRGLDAVIRRTMNAGEPQVLSPALHRYLLPLPGPAGTPMLQVVRILPHHTDHQGTGALITIEDMSALARAEEAFLRVLEQLRLLQESAGSLAAPGTLEDRLQLIADRALEALSAQVVLIYTYDQETHTLQHVAGATRFSEEYVRSLFEAVNLKEEHLTIIPLSTAGSVLGRAALNTQPLIGVCIEDLNAPSEVQRMLNHLQEVLGWEALTILPLRVGDRPVGVMAFDSPPADLMARHERALYMAFAQQAAVAVENARLYAETEAQRRRVAVEQQRLTHLIECLPEGVVLLDAETRVVLTNATGKAYLRLLAQMGPEDRLTRLGNYTWDELLQLSPDQSGHQITHNGASPQVFEALVRPVEAGPESGGFVLIIRDVTWERQVQERIQQQERLAAVGQLAAGIAHEFNNILQGMIGFADLIARDAASGEKARERARLIYSQGNRAARLIRQILDFSRRSVYQQAQPLDLVPFLKEITKFLEQTLPEPITVRFTRDPGDYWVHADPTQLQQVVLNLAANARDAMPDGGTLTIHLTHAATRPGERPPVPDLPPGEWHVLSVSDTGTGIPSEILPHIFEPFFTTKRPGQGTGLGLAQVYGIVKQHDGYIDVRTGVGEGTTVSVYLPAWSPAQLGQLTDVEKRVSAGYGETILVVEDEEFVCDVIRTLLEDLGYRVLTARNGQEALTLYQAHSRQITLVITDLVMPDMRGTHLLKQLQAQDSKLKAIVITGYPVGEEESAALEGNIIAWLQKPFDREDLAQAVRKALGDHPT